VALPEANSNPKMLFHVYALGVTGFLGGIGATLLVLLVQSADRYPYFEALLPFQLPFPSEL
jgi:hypothetical protein